MSWKNQLKGDSLSWLLEPGDPGVRHLALRDLCDLAPDDPDLAEARRLAHASAPISQVMQALQPAGYWVKPGPGYHAKYRGSVWAITLLAQLGASPASEPRLDVAINYLLEQALTPQGQFSMTGAPADTIDCLQGNLCNALLDLGCSAGRLERALEWMARSITGEGVAPAGAPGAGLHYFVWKCGPLFACHYNHQRPCAWGAVKCLLAFSKLPAPWQQTSPIKQAIQAGVDFLFSVDPLEATYPTARQPKPSRDWWKPGFPVFYVTDLLQNVEALTRLGYGQDPRLAPALQWLINKQDEQGRWALERDYPGRTWGDFGPKKQANKWVTHRAARILKLAFGN